MAAGLAAKGVAAHVLAVDAVAALEPVWKSRSAAVPRPATVKFVAAEVGHLAEGAVAASSVGAIVEKALLDSVLCGEVPAEARAEGGRIVADLYRALAPGGVWVHVTVTEETTGIKAPLFEVPWADVTVVPIERGGDAQPVYIFVFQKP